MRTIMLAAGGTGGHMFPARALAGVLQKRGWRIVLVTDARGRKLCDGFPADDIFEVASSSPGGRNLLRLVLNLLRLFFGVMRSLVIIGKERPAVIVGFGGYPSFPVLAAAWLGRKPTVLHEQNSVLGRVNRVFARRAKVIASGFDSIERLPPDAAPRHRVTGNPLRAALVRQSQIPDAAPDGDAFHLLVLGGSLGAKILSETVPQALALLPDAARARLRVVQQTRPAQEDFARTVYKKAGIDAELAPFFDDIEKRLHRADLVIARAGASTVSELAAMGRPCVLVPLVIAMDDHQSGNAKVLVDAGAADSIHEEKLTPERLAALIGVRMDDRADLLRRGAAAKRLARLDAADILAHIVEDVAGETQ